MSSEKIEYGAGALPLSSTRLLPDESLFSATVTEPGLMSDVGSDRVGLFWLDVVSPRWHAGSGKGAVDDDAAPCRAEFGDSVA